MSETKSLAPVYTQGQGDTCRDCYNCLRRCPVKAIKVEDSTTDILIDMCIACGKCVQHCTRKLKSYRNDVEAVKKILTQKKRVFVSLAPSFTAEWGDASKEQLVAALKGLGFFAVSETALGAELVSAEIAKRLSAESDKKLFISSVCPSIVKYIKLYYPKFAPYILDIPSPLLAHSRLLKKIYGDDIGVVFVGSCISKKIEADQFEEIDAVLTFNEMRMWMSRRSITPKELEASECQFLPYPAAGGSLYGAENDFAISKEYADLPNVISIAHSGFDAIKNILRGFDPAALTETVFMSLLACSGGCINGPGMSAYALRGANRTLSLLEYAKNAECKSSCPKNEDIDMTGSLSFLTANKQQHSEEAIRAAFEKIEKYSKRDELNCGSCGYDTCRNFVEAMLANRAKKTMCVSYMRTLTERQASGLLQAIPSGVVVVDKNLSIIECNKNFACLFGSDIEELFEISEGLHGAHLEKITKASEYFDMFFKFSDSDHHEFNFNENKKILHLNIFSIEKGETAAGVIDDITTPQMQKNKTIENAKAIIDKNVSVVQQIAFLLGEHAAETESILHSIIQAFNTDGEAK